MYKFRAWSIEGKFYIENWQDSTANIIAYGFNGGDRFIVEQSTEEADKNSNMSFTGDIVRSYFNESNYLIKFGDHTLTDIRYECDDDSLEVKCTGFYLERIGEHEGDIESFAGDFEFAIIGTVNENPELLEVNNG